MFKIMKQRFSYLYSQKNLRKYEITHLGLIRFSKLKPRSQTLLIDMLSMIKMSLDLDKIVFSGTYKDFGFKSRQNFYVYRDELIKEHMLFYKDDRYFVNPCFINFLNRRQQTFFFNMFGFKTKERVVMTPPSLRIIN